MNLNYIFIVELHDNPTFNHNRARSVKLGRGEYSFVNNTNFYFINNLFLRSYLSLYEAPCSTLAQEP